MPQRDSHNDPLGFSQLTTGVCAKSALNSRKPVAPMATMDSRGSNSRAQT
jgi:hypothetical protein